MPNLIEEKAIKFVLKKFPNARKSDNKTFDLIIDGKYVELKSKGSDFEKIDFISLTSKQFNAIERQKYEIFLVCGLKTGKTKLYRIDPLKLKKQKPRIITSYEFDRTRLKGLLREYK